ncbi:hypothetical protein J437_LFUL005966 [Ladona fulva]|uniref:Uncharacterized protein n=1 Tax=Ladona fulva TaxID=123851 RepID=A0A8K0K239_LADFU|nr:hypothetical protein J437_LFUL005966 [Ladona fulva]
MYAEEAFHAAILLYYAVVNHYVFYGINNAHRLLGRPLDDALVNRMLSGSPTYYTGWNLAIQELYFILRMVEHLLKFLSIASSERLRRWTRMILSVFVAPGSCAVVFMFWSVYAVSPGLVYGDFLDDINPVWVNHAIHTNVALIALLELYLRAQSDDIWNGGFVRGALTFAAFLIFYTITS